jgi:hypothetical protein
VRTRTEVVPQLTSSTLSEQDEDAIQLRNHADTAATDRVRMSGAQVARWDLRLPILTRVTPNWNSSAKGGLRHTRWSLTQRRQIGIYSRSDD